MCSRKPVCKEICSSCKCIVKERPRKCESKDCDDIKKKDNYENNKKKANCDDITYKKNNCTATIVGVITLPENLCNQGTNEPEKEEFEKEECEKEECEQDDCKEVFRDFGECLQKCIVKVSKNDDDNKMKNDFC